MAWSKVLSKKLGKLNNSPSQLSTFAEAARPLGLDVWGSQLLVWPFFFFNTPLKINMEHNHGGLEDHFPF